MRHYGMMIIVTISLPAETLLQVPLALLLKSKLINKPDFLNFKPHPLDAMERMGDSVIKHRMMLNHWNHLT